jgi:hypothetical protein
MTCFIIACQQTSSYCLRKETRRCKQTQVCVRKMWSLITVPLRSEIKINAVQPLAMIPEIASFFQKEMLELVF